MSRSPSLRFSSIIRPEESGIGGTSLGPMPECLTALRHMLPLHTAYFDFSAYTKRVEGDDGIPLPQTGDESVSFGGWLSVKKESSAAGGVPKPFCLTDPRGLEAVAGAVRRAARRFGDLLIDDFSDFPCTCAGCKTKKGKRTWGEFRRTESLNYAREVLRAPALSANPVSRLTLRIPPDADALYSAGYNVLALAQLFHHVTLSPPSDPSGATDEDSAASVVVAGCRLFRWMQEEVGRKMLGGELRESGSVPARQSPERPPTREEQAVALTLSGATELLLDLRGVLPDDAVLSSLAHEFPSLPGLRNVASKTPQRGIALYRPRNAMPGEDTPLPDRLSLLGFPLRPTPRFPSSSRSAIFTLESFADPALPEKLQTYLRQGKACITPALHAALYAQGYHLEEDEYLRVRPFPVGSEENVEATESVNGIRDFLLSPLGLSYAGPVGVTLHLFGHRDFVLQNFTAAPAALRLSLPHRSLRVSSTSDPEWEVATELVNGEVVLGPHCWLHLTG